MSLDALAEFRSMLDRRRQAEEVIATQIETRREATAHADDALSRANALARELEESAREAARVTTEEATARAAQIVADAEARAARITADAEAALARSLEDVAALAETARAALDRARTDLGSGAGTDDRRGERRRNPFRSVH
jgi:cell division septum initiation protein DivIVA